MSLIHPRGILIRVRRLPFGHSAMTIFPFIIYTGKMPAWLRNHERVHLAQQVELLLVFFYLWYFMEFLIHFVTLGSRKKAYRRISFEREAYVNDDNLEYLNVRKPFSFIKYMKLER